MNGGVFDVQSMQGDVVAKQLNEWLGRKVYVHLEVNPGAYWRNGTGQLRAVHVKGEGPYRVFLEFDNPNGLIQVDTLTHMVVEPELIVCTGLDEHERLARTVEVSLKPFAV